MSTELQKNLAQEIIKNTKRKKPKNKKELLVSAGYDETTATATPGDIIGQKGVKEALEDLGFTEESAKKVVLSIMMNERVDPNARLKATDQVFKVRGSYAPEKSINLNVEVSSEKQKQANDILARFLNGNTNNTTR
jgi:hypothetical protein